MDGWRLVAAEQGINLNNLIGPINHCLKLKPQPLVYAPTINGFNSIFMSVL